jgi:glutamate dehydrogenase
MLDDGRGPASPDIELSAATEGGLRLRLVWPADPALLSDVLPPLESLGLRVADHRLGPPPPGRPPATRVDDFGVVCERTDLPLSMLAPLVRDTFAAVWDGRAEVDGLNALVLAAGLSWRQVALIRAAYRYLRQAGLTFSQAYVERTLGQRPAVARAVVAAFAERLDPVGGSVTDAGAVGEFEHLLEQVTNLDEDRLLRGLWQFVLATVRTNYFQHGLDSEPKPYFSFKLDTARLPLLPRPRPPVETFVYSPQMEGLHLRAAKVARGGIRWSDRPEDFRTEVLGLATAQHVKNAVIVPGGAKGAFVVKRPLEALEKTAAAAEVRRCYVTFIRGLLDITDNIVEGAIVAPPETVCLDDPDPYLVVAADKGTASFSDLANEVAAEYYFWLGDAFASGGSAGYDHKTMGITARGAWVSVRHHFRELGVDARRQEITVVGIGDMSGDVFGNGMLLSRQLRLVGAFDHRHVFLDPDPDPEISFAERERLFRLPGSTWMNYDTAVLSPGGGIFARTAKSIPLSALVRRRLGVDAVELPPAEVIQALLRAPVDLLWNGGIGTYVKASGETNTDAADRANDAVRVDAKTLRCRVVAEGGNLGVTRRGRIEYADAGGRINTDFIDNSAGVDTSDHEVNLKILLDAAVLRGELDRAERDDLLSSVADDVVRDVLRDNELQAEAISAAEAQSSHDLDRHARLIRNLEAETGLDRALESLPDEAELATRQESGQGLPRPDIAVLLAHSKNLVREELLRSDVPANPYFGSELYEYFPSAVVERCRPWIADHPLHREIIATRLSNDLVNALGPGFIYRLQERTGAGTADVTRAYRIVRDVFKLPGGWAGFAGADAGPVRPELCRDVQLFLEHTLSWLLRTRRQPLDVTAEVERFRSPLEEFRTLLPSMLSLAQTDRLARRTGELVASGVSESVAASIAELAPLTAALDIVELGSALGRHPDLVARTYFAVSDALGLDWLETQVVGEPLDSHWELAAKAGLRDEVAMQRRRLTAGVLRGAGPGDTSRILADWLEDNAQRVARCRQVLRDLMASGDLDLAMLSVALHEVRDLTQTSGWGAAELGPPLPRPGR